MEYPLTADEAVKIPLTPKYVAADLADTIPYSVKVYLGSENTEPIESFEYRGIAGPAIEEGAYIERPEIKAVIDQYQDEYPEKEIIGIESLSNTDNVVKIILKKEYVQIHTLVEEEGSVSHGNYQYGSDTFDNKDLMVRSGDTIRLKIVPDEGYTIGQLFIGGTPQTIDRSKIDEDGNYEIEYTVSETATIWTSFAADINGNGEPDETETTYSITYAAGTAGTNAQNMPQNKTDILSGTTQTISAAVPTWTGYVFTGWTSTDVTETAGSFTMPEKDVTFTATWKEDANGDGEPDDTETKYSITYSDGEAKGAAQGMPAKAESILSGTTQTISTAVPTWTGYVFAGWTSNEVQATSGSFTMPEKDVTFTATWKVDANGNGEPDDTEAKYSITYSDGEAKGAAQGMPAKAENILSGTTQTISAAVPTWTGHVFTGWTSTDVTETAGNFTMPEKDVTFTAAWKVDANGDGEPDENEQKYSISYYDGEANGNAEKMPQNETDILSGTTKTLPTTEPTWTGHVFTGWTSDEVQATTGNFIMPEANVTFTAAWKVDANGDGEPDDTETKYSITYSDGEAKGAAQGMPAKAENILSGTTQTISAAVPTWTGYVFTGWTSTDVTETTGSFTMPEKDVTFTATWKVDANGNGEPDENEQKYSISYSDGEAKGAAQGMPAKAENILSGTTQPISVAEPTWTGHVFAGWTSTDVTETTGSFTMPEKDVTFTALWKEYSSGGSKEEDDDDASEENGSGSSRKPVEAQKGQVVNAAGKTGEWVLEGNQFTEQNGYIPSREYLKIDGNIYGFYSRGYAIGSEHGHYYTSEAIAAAGGYRDAQGAWNLNGWWVRYSDGTYPHGQWEYLTYNGRSDWYYFDEDGWMEDGWFQWEDHWYYLHTEYDGFRGHMYTGWHEIGGKWYYFRTDQDGGTPGAMMTDARTPDGFYVGEDGAWIQ